MPSRRASLLLRDELSRFAQHVGRIAEPFQGDNRPHFAALVQAWRELERDFGAVELDESFERRGLTRQAGELVMEDQAWIDEIYAVVTDVASESRSCFVGRWRVPVEAFSIEGWEVHADE